MRLAGLFWRVGRYTSMVENQARGLRKRWLIASLLCEELEGTYWAIGTSTSRYEEQLDGTHRDFTGYPEALVDDVISEVRTDMDAFSDAEIAVLENHGYLLAEAALQTHAASLIDKPAPVKIPHELWMDKDKVTRALASSSKRKLLGSGSEDGGGRETKQSISRKILEEPRRPSAPSVGDDAACGTRGAGG